jgi:hypothetical protein
MNWYKLSKNAKVIPLDDLFVGKADKENITENDVNPEELRMGIEIELEHTHDKNMAKKIALDHLAEIPDYYSRLKRMESNVELDKAAKIESFFVKQASMSVYVKGFDYPQKLNNISRLCYYLFDKTWKAMEQVLTPEELKKWTDDGMHSDFFAPDGFDHDAIQGTINNYVKAFPAKKIGWLVSFVRQKLQEINVRIVEIRQEKFKDSNEIRVIRYVVDANPNANVKHDEPPEIFFNAGHVLALLDVDMDSSVTLNSMEAYQKLQQLLQGDNLSNKLVEKQRAPMGEPDFQRLREKVQIVGEVAKWAVDHGYQEIYFA